MCPFAIEELIPLLSKVAICIQEINAILKQAVGGVPLLTRVQIVASGGNVDLMDNLTTTNRVKDDLEISGLEFLVELVIDRLSIPT